MIAIEDRSRGKEQIPEAHLKQWRLAPDNTDDIEDEGDQSHRDHEVNDDRMDRVHPRQVVVVERR